MTGNNQQPRPDDAVIGGHSPDISTSVALGGIEGVIARFNSTDEGLPAAGYANRIGALKQAIQYGEEGLDLILKGLEDPTDANTVRLSLKRCCK